MGAYGCPKKRRVKDWTKAEVEDCVNRMTAFEYFSICCDGKTPDGKWCRPKKPDPSRQVTSRLTKINIGDVVYIGTDNNVYCKTCGEKLLKQQRASQMTGGATKKSM